ARRIKKKESPSVDKVPLISICTASLAITYLFQWFFSNQEKTKITNLIVTSLFAYIDLVCLLILFVLRTRSQLKEENRLLEQVISSDAKEYESSKENMEIINMKFHDIKHEIYLLKSDSNPDELKEVEDSIQLYDNMPKTGNKVLNVILTKELLICEKRNIKFTYMIEAKDLSVFLPTDLNSLFINLIDNAIEYLSNIKDETKRMMSLRVQSHSNLLSIHIENYFEGNVKFENGLPITTKGDKETHGLGLKSVRYIISKYDGNMVIGTKESYFIVDILIPIKNV
ncbi:MAG: ATP-binding protein, partial [Bacilli bacterium]